MRIGLTAGVKADVHTVGITTGYDTADKIREVNPSTIISGFSELTKIIK